jgi:hypothetical protein
MVPVSSLIIGPLRSCESASASVQSASNSFRSSSVMNRVSEDETARKTIEDRLTPTPFASFGI